jgi:hypothetical protein
MTRREAKEVKKLANYIFNNLTVSEMFHILAEKSSEVAKKIVIEKLETEEYKRILLQKKEKEAKLQKRKKLFQDTKEWIIGLFTPKPVPKPQKAKKKKEGIKKINNKREKYKSKKSTTLSTKK